MNNFKTICNDKFAINSNLLLIKRAFKHAIPCLNISVDNFITSFVKYNFLVIKLQKLK